MSKGYDYLLIALGMSFLGNIFAWFHMNAQFKWEWARSHWWILLGGIPISYLFFFSTRMFHNYFGDYWSVRPIGFGMATFVFGIMTWLILHEVPDTRTMISIALAVVIIGIQLSHLVIK